MSVEPKPYRRGFFFWSLSPFLLIFLVVMPLVLPKPPHWAGYLIFWVLEVLVALMLLGLYNPIRFHWAWRGVGAILFGGTVAYLISMAVAGKFAMPQGRHESNFWNALGALFVFGLPGLCYAIWGQAPVNIEVVDDTAWERMGVKDKEET